MSKVTEWDGSIHYIWNRGFTGRNYFHDTPESLSKKYFLAKSHGASVDLARRIRHWPLIKIERLFGLK